MSDGWGGPPPGPDVVYVQQKMPPSDGLITATYILAASSLIISPFCCGGLAIICAIIAIAQGHPKGITALIVAIVLPLISFFITLMLLGSNPDLFMP